MKKLTSVIVLCAIYLTSGAAVFAGGMSANKARLLNTNSRQPNIEYSAQKIQIEKNNNQIQRQTNTIQTEQKNSIQRQMNTIQTQQNSNIERSFNVFGK